MGSIWTVQPTGGERKDLVWVTPKGAEPFSIWLKDILSVGEDRKVKTAGWRGVGGVGAPAGQQEINIDWKAQGVIRAHTWLVDWTLADDKRNKLPLTVQTIEALHPDVFELIENAITAHVEDLEAKKKATAPTPDGGSSAPSQTSA